MDITKKTDGNTVTLALAGRLDVVTCAQLSSELAAVFQSGAVNLVFDFSRLEYISSAGLRVLIITQKKVTSLGTKMKITGVIDTVREVFDVTGFSGIMEIS